MAKPLTRAAILAASDVKSEEVNVPEWGGIVRIAAMNGAARDEYRTALAGAELGQHVSLFAATLLSLCCVDEAGNRLFDAADIPALRAKSTAALDALIVVAMRINGLGGSAVEDARKNSESIQSDDSGSDSPKS